MYKIDWYAWIDEINDYQLTGVPVSSADPTEEWVVIFPFTSYTFGDSWREKRVQFSNDPPYSSMRLLKIGEKKLWSR
jgi:hypothetical protein